MILEETSIKKGAIIFLVQKLISEPEACNFQGYNGSSGSSGRVRGGGEKHEIYAGTFSGHLFYDLFSQGRGAWPHRPPPWIRY